MSRAKILLVDDQSVVRHIYRKTLENAGHQVVETVDYEGAISLFDSSIDLALVDIVLEGKSGLEILTYIRRKQPLCPVIMISAHANKNNTLDALHKGAVDYLEKPIHQRELKHVVEHWLSYRTLKEENIYLYEEQQLQYELRESELRYRHLIEAIPDGVLVCCEGRIVYGNKAATVILKAEGSDALIGVELLQLARPEQRESMADNIQHALQEQTSVVGLEGRLLKLNGESFDAEFSIMHTDHLNKAAVQLVIQDITKRKQVEEKLRLSESRFRGIFEGATGGVMLASLDGRLLQVNDYICDLLGYTDEELLQKTFMDITPPADLDREMSIFKKALAGELSRVSFEKRYIHRNGHFVWILIGISVLKDRHGIPEYFVALIQNISERKRIENALLESEIRFRTMVEQSPLAIQVLSTDGRTIRVNKAWEKLWGVSFEALASYNVLQDQQLIDKGVIPYIERAMAGEATEVSEVYYDREATPEVPSDSCSLWVRTFMYPVKDQSGAVLEVVLVQENISNSKRAEQALQEHTEKLECFNKMAVGRELRMIELKKEINDLLTELGREKQYIIHTTKVNKDGGETQ